MSRKESLPTKKHFLSPIRERLLMHLATYTRDNTHKTNEWFEASSFIRWELRFSGLLYSEYWQFLTDVTGRPIVPSFKVQESKNKILDPFKAYLLRDAPTV